MAGGNRMDRLTEMEAFVAVVELGGFTDAARKLGVSKSAVSKHVATLEQRLGARLFNRTTRRVSPTEIGLAYYDRARRVITDAVEADALVASMQSEPSGLLRLAVATDFGTKLLAPVLGEFLHSHPAIKLNMHLTNRHVELIAEGHDMAIRLGELTDSSLRARRLTEATMKLIASPTYLAQHGRPEKIEDLASHRLLYHTTEAGEAVWRLTAPSGERRVIRASGTLMVNDGRSLMHAVTAGLGIAYLPSFLYADALNRDEIEEVIPGLPTERLAIHVVYPQGPFTQPKIRAFIDFLAKKFERCGPDIWC